MLPPSYTDQFDTLLATRGQAEQTQKTLRSMLRRMSRELDEADLVNEEVMFCYRTHLANGTRGIFDMTWKALQETPVGCDLPAFKRLPVMVYPHPLFADLMHLGALLGNDRLPELKFGVARHLWGWDETAAVARRRVWEWFMGVGTPEHAETPLVVKDGAGRGMRIWQVEFIINSSVRMNRSNRAMKMIRRADLVAKAIGASFAFRMSASELRALYENATQGKDETRLSALEEALKAGTKSSLLAWVERGERMGERVGNSVEGKVEEEGEELGEEKGPW